MPVNCASQHGQDVVQSTLKCDAAPTSQTTRSGKRTAATAGVGMSLTNSKAAKLYKIKIIPDARAAATARKRYNSAVDRVNSKHSKHRVTQPTSPAVYTRSDTFWASVFIGYQHGYVFKLSDQGTGSEDAVQWAFEMPLLIRHLAEDLRTFYHEAIAAQPGPSAPNHAALNEWIFGGTALGETLQEVAHHLTALDTPLASLVRGLLIPEGHYQGGSAF